MKSIMIKTFIGWAVANFVMHMSSVAHQPLSSVWDLILIAFITWGAMVMVFAICSLYTVRKQYKESEAKYREAVEKWEAIVKEITAK